MGATFAFTESIVANTREKDDALNGVAGGCAAGFLAGIRGESRLAFCPHISPHDTDNLQPGLYRWQSRRALFSERRSEPLIMQERILLVALRRHKKRGEDDSSNTLSLRHLQHHRRRRPSRLHFGIIYLALHQLKLSFPQKVAGIGYLQLYHALSTLSRKTQRYKMFN